MRRLKKMSDNKARLIIISAPSGCGKGTLLNKVFGDSDAFYSVSCTTRDPRPEDIEGVTYHFLTEEEFEKMIADDGFLEYAKYSRNYYGTPKKPVEDNLAAGRDVLLEIETQGAFKVKAVRSDAVSLFILPPSVAELDRRLHKRATEEEDVIARRVAEAAGEIAKAEQYDYVIMNDDLDAAVADLTDVVKGIKGDENAIARFSPKNEEIKKMIREVLENA